LSRGEKPKGRNTGRSISASGGRRRKSVLVRGGGRPQSSIRWLQRQLNDPYVLAAKENGYRSRAAFKLIELDDKFKIFASGNTVVDLGAAPGGWSQIASQKVGRRGNVIGVDTQFIDPIGSVTFLQLDVSDAKTIDKIMDIQKRPADVVLSDMAARSTGHASTDHLRVITLAEAAAEIATQILAPGGIFVTKVFKGGTESRLLHELKLQFDRVKHAKPPSSRSGSAEEYVVAKGFRQPRH
tara:strand:- start:1236 stop:1955 length:720 start_codon:yes stop_codon:yes gene_type:complete